MRRFVHLSELKAKKVERNILFYLIYAAGFVNKRCILYLSSSVVYVY